MARGAVALISAARIALVLNRMDQEEAVKLGIDSDKDRRQHFSVQDDKHNRAPPEAAEWYHIQGVDLGNGDSEHEGDNIGVVARWTPPDVFEGISLVHLREVQRAVAAGNWRKSEQSHEWVGHAIAGVLDLDAAKPLDRKRVQRLLREWLKNDVLREERRMDTRKSRLTPYIVVGKLVDGPSPPTPPSVGTRWGSGDTETPPHRPLKGGGGVGWLMMASLTMRPPFQKVDVIRRWRMLEFSLFRTCSKTACSRGSGLCRSGAGFMRRLARLPERPK